MNSNVQQKPGVTISESPGSGSENPDTRSPVDTKVHFSDEVWQRHLCPSRVAPQMARIDRTLQAIHGLHTLLQRDWRGVSMRDTAPESCTHSGLDSFEIDSLHSAADLLIGDAMACVYALRENKDDCWGTGGRA